MQTIFKRISLASRRYLRGAAPNMRAGAKAFSKSVVKLKHASCNTGGYASWLPYLGALAATGYALGGDIADNCGIVGVVGSDDASKFLLEGLFVLRNRGYDSAGMATISTTGDLHVSKYASLNTTSDSIDRLKENSAVHDGTSTGIAHTRWATHGGRTDQNAHPHVDFGNRIALVHNGTINNSYDLRKELIEKGIKFSSETDTEVIAHLVGLQLDAGFDSKDALSNALSRCDGSWGICMVNKANPNEIVIACNGSPMVIGIGNGTTFIASETSAFSRYTKSFISLRDGEIGVVTPKTTSLDLARIQMAPDHEVLLTPAPYDHFTMKECREQPESIARAMSYGARMCDNRIVLGGLDSNRAKMAEVRNMLLTACGTSKYASELGAKIMRDLGCFDTVSVLDSAEVRTCDIPHKHGAVLAVSQSGETKDVVRAIKLAQSSNVLCMSVVNSVGALIPRLTGIGVYLNAGREHAVASTKAFTSQVTVLALIALWFRQLRDETEPDVTVSPLEREYRDSLQRMPISFGMAFTQHEKCKRIAKEINDSKSLFVLGKGYGEPIALEGAFKLKEIGYIHAEGCSGGALKHGPFALIEGKEGEHGPTPVICLILDDDHAHLMRTVAEEVKSRGAKVYVITDKPKLAQGIDNDPILIPNNGPMTALTAVLPLQLLAYELAILRGVNPDVPRNLAKAVTVD